MLIFKIVHNDEWRAAEAAGIYRGSAKDQADGFLHFSTEDQLIGTLTRYYADAEDLVLVRRCREPGRRAESRTLDGRRALSASLWRFAALGRAMGSADRARCARGVCARGAYLPLNFPTLKVRVRTGSSSFPLCPDVFRTRPNPVLLNDPDGALRRGYKYPDVISSAVIHVEFWLSSGMNVQHLSDRR